MVYKFATVMVLVHAAMAANGQVKKRGQEAADATTAGDTVYNDLLNDEAMMCEMDRLDGMISCQLNCEATDQKCYDNCDRDYDYSCWNEESAGEKIKDAIEDVLEQAWDRYADEEAIEQWA